MKKLVFLLVCLFTLQTVARADDDKPIQVTQMPQLAQQFIKQHFSDSKVALAKMESDFLYKSYEVIFTNGDKVEFDNKGNWEDGILYIDDYLIQAQDTIESTCTIKPGTKVIADSAFYHCENLCRVILPDSVISIGKSAFESCENLCSVTIPGSVASVGERAFEACLNLSDITIPDSVISIGERAFKSCWSLSSIAIPDSVSDIGIWAFYNTGYYYDETNWEKSWEGDVLYLGNHLIEAKPLSGAYTVKNGTKTIASGAFRCNNGLLSITIPDSVTSIGDKAFWFCDNLSEIILPDSITSIGADAFDSTAYANDEVNWNENMLYLGNYLIEINYNDSDVYNVKSSTKVIADDVFSNCKNPSSITIPSSVIHIGEGNNIVTKQTHNIDNYLHLSLIHI